MIKSQYDINELISLKNLKKAYNTNEIQYIVNSYTEDNINELQMTRWLKSICENGMNYQETIDYTRCIVNSGKQLSFKNEKGWNNHLVLTKKY